MFSSRRKTTQLIGIDISSTAIKLLELSQAAGATADLYRVEAFAVEPLPPSAVVEKKISDIDAVGQGIKRAVVSLGTKAKRAAVAVSGSAVITKVIAMTASLSDAEMEMQIQLEADQYIPYPLEEVNIDFDVLGSTPGNAEMVDVLLAASRRENVDDRVAALEIGGLGAAIVDVEAYAMENACTLLLGRFEDERHDQTVAVVDVGASATTLHVLHDGKTVYTREAEFRREPAAGRGSAPLRHSQAGRTGQAQCRLPAREFRHRRPRPVQGSPGATIARVAVFLLREQL